MPREKSVGAVIYRKENGKIYYLLLKYTAKHWDFTKGHIEAGETDDQTLRREAKEETGIKDLRVIKDFKEYHKYFFKQYKDKMTKADIEKGRPVWVFKLVNFYLAETKTKEIKLSIEHQDYKWLLYDDALKLVTFKNAKELLLKANDFLIKNKI
jgi:8-oxo-dGTP pyrophosphatase MutT (NUDIX family)